MFRSKVVALFLYSGREKYGVRTGGKGVTAVELEGRLEVPIQHCESIWIYHVVCWSFDKKATISYKWQYPHLWCLITRGAMLRQELLNKEYTWHSCLWSWSTTFTTPTFPVFAFWHTLGTLEMISETVLHHKWPPVHVMSRCYITLSMLWHITLYVRNWFLVWLNLKKRAGGRLFISILIRSCHFCKSRNIL